jgi:hypothetical protein
LLYIGTVLEIVAIAAASPARSTRASPAESDPAGVITLAPSATTGALQVERSGRWYAVATTHENASGAFSFTIRGTAAGTRDYRAVVSDLAGYLQFGYSAARALKVS